LALPLGRDEQLETYGRFAMRPVLPTLACVIALGITVPTTHAQSADDHKLVAPNQVKWSPGPPSLPKGAEASLLFGDPSKEGLFVMRIKLPKGYHIPAHSHPKPELVTVISGTFRIGMGDVADQSKVEALPTGGFVALPPGMTHFVYVDEDTVVQLNSSGPWSVNYVNPKDDPRQKTQ
jgi:quercetin dioxygenase-like cupin family protein